MKLFYLLLLYCGSVFGASYAIADEIQLHYFQTDHRYDYRTELLRHALSYSNQQAGMVNVELVEKTDVPPARAQLQLKNNEFLGVVSLAVNKQRERDFLPIRIPILAGALGMRVFLIHEERQSALNSIHTVEELRALKAGFVNHWGDTGILRYNGLPMVTSARYEPLFDMLMAKRFDYFPRGVNEIQSELFKYQVKHAGLAIEKNLAIYYPYPVYFFVNKLQTALASRLEYGLKQAIADGSFKALFLKHHEEMLKTLNVKQRRIIYLENPTLPEGIAEPDLSLWLK